MTDLDDDPLLPCPPWCTGDHSGQESWKGDRYHESAPVTLDLTDTPVCIRMRADLTQYPMATRVRRRRVYVSLCLEDWSRELDVPDVHTLADGLVEYSGRLRELAARLAEAQRADFAARSDRT
jgi:hypothetical protein